MHSMLSGTASAGRCYQLFTYQQTPKSSRTALSCKCEQTDSKGSRTTEDSNRPQLNIQDPSQTVVWGGQLPSRRRILTGGLSALSIVLVSNLGGTTGALLSLDGGELAGKLHLDVLYPVSGLKRCLDAQNGFDVNPLRDSNIDKESCRHSSNPGGAEFQYPASWLADQRMFRRNAERAEQLLDPPTSGQRRRNVAEPVAAFGPPGSSGELNVSVIVAPIQSGFQLSSLGGPQKAGERFLSTTIAPEGSGLETELLNTTQRTDENGQLYYSLEYTVQRPGVFFRHNLSSYAARSGSLFTLNAQSPEAAWKENKQQLQQRLRRSIDSFKVTAPGSLPPGLTPPR